MRRLPRMTALASAAFMMLLLGVPISVHAETAARAAAVVQEQADTKVRAEVPEKLRKLPISTVYGMTTSLEEIGFLPMTVQDVFDSTYYAAHYPDVVEVYGTKPENLYRHFVTFGLKEERIGSTVLDIAKYRKLYPDLDEAFGDDWDRYVQHFFTMGLLEGRNNGFALTKIIDSKQRQSNSWQEISLTSAPTVHVTNDGIVTDGQGTILIPWEDVSTFHYLTMEELRQKLGNSLTLFQDSDGNIVFIGGTFTDAKVHDEQGAKDALRQLMKLMNFPEDREELYLTKRVQDSTGNLYYRFSAKLRGDDYYRLLSDTDIVLGTDPNGTVLCMSSNNATHFYEIDEESLSQIGYDAEKWNALYQRYTAEYPDITIDPQPVLKYYFEGDRNQFYWTVILREKDKVIEVPLSEKKTEYQMISFLTRTYSAAAYGTAESYSNDIYFRQEESEDPRAAVTELTFQDAYGYDVVLPVAWSEKEQQYYLCDKKRKIICMDRFRQNEKDEKMYFIAPELIEDGRVRPEAIEGKYVTAFHNMQRLADTYRRLHALDDHDTILINLNRDIQQPQASLGMRYGGVFIELYDSDVAVEFDTLAHELNHGVLQLLTNGLPYQGQTGAIDEAYADILGNLLEMITYEALQGDPSELIDSNTISGWNSGMLGEVDTIHWTFGEVGAAYSKNYPYNPDGTTKTASQITSITRSMSNPNLYGTPTRIGDIGYQADGGRSDHGGVHFNSTILSHIAYEMETDPRVALSKEEIFRIWYDTLPLLNEDVTYKRLKQYVLYSMEQHHIEQAKIDAVHQLFEKSGIEDQKPEYFNWSDITLSDDAKMVAFSLSHTYNEKDQIDTNQQINVYFYRTKNQDLCVSNYDRQQKSVRCAIIPAESTVNKILLTLQTPREEVICEAYGSISPQPKQGQAGSTTQSDKVEQLSIDLRDVIVSSLNGKDSGPKMKSFPYNPEDFISIRLLLVDRDGNPLPLYEEGTDYSDQDVLVWDGAFVRDRSGDHSDVEFEIAFPRNHVDNFSEEAPSMQLVLAKGERYFFAADRYQYDNGTLQLTYGKWSSTSFSFEDQESYQLIVDQTERPTIIGIEKRSFSEGTSTAEQEKQETSETATPAAETADTADTSESADEVPTAESNTAPETNVTSTEAASEPEAASEQAESAAETESAEQPTESAATEASEVPEQPVVSEAPAQSAVSEAPEPSQAPVEAPAEAVSEASPEVEMSEESA